VDLYFLNRVKFSIFLFFYQSFRLYVFFEQSFCIFFSDVIATDLYVCKTGESVNAKIVSELEVVGEDCVLFVFTAAAYDGLITRF